MDVITENSSSWKLCLLHSIYIFYTSRMFFRNLHFTILLDNPERISLLGCHKIIKMSTNYHSSSLGSESDTACSVPDLD